VLQYHQRSEKKANQNESTTEGQLTTAPTHNHFKPQLSRLLMNKPGFADSSGGGICEQRGVGSARVRFNINEVEEDHRTQRGIEARRERKKNKKMENQNREGRIRSTLEIILRNSLAAALVQLCNANRRVGGLLNIFLDDFVPRNQNMSERLAAFRALPRRRFTHLPPASENMLLAMQGDPDFSSTFSAYLPSAVITSEDSDDDSPRARRLRRRRRRRQRQQTRQEAENRRRASA